MSTNQQTPKIPLPKGWKQHVRAAVLRVISLAQYATVYTRSWAADGASSRLRLKAQLERANQEVALLREEVRIKDARMARIDPHRRPHYRPVERLAILQLRAARGWSLDQTADVFHVTVPTISSWIRRLEEQGPHALVQLRQPVNRFPDFIRYVVQQLKALCPTMGKKMLAQALARAGLHLGLTSVHQRFTGPGHTRMNCRIARSSSMTTICVAAPDIAVAPAPSHSSSDCHITARRWPSSDSDPVAPD